MKEITYMMVEKETGGFTTGIVKRGCYSEEEISNNKHHELIKGIKLLTNCEWIFNITK
ncbi:MAG: hypothetical protein JKY53_14705 [Flavobacteriales bacterium]|nr:hypothetical protein [Flavobacteriales bacterium]